MPQVRRSQRTQGCRLITGIAYAAGHGIIPAIIAMLVINMGRNRMPALTHAALNGSLYSSRKDSALVTIRIAFATETPVDMIIPI